MSDASLDRLEESVVNLIELVKTLQGENESLRHQIHQSVQELEELRKDNEAKRQLVERFENDRLKIRSRVEQMIEQISALEEPNREPSPQGPYHG